MRLLICFLFSLLSPLLAQEYLSPVDIAFHGKQLVLAEHDSSRLDIFDPSKGKITDSIQLAGKPTGIFIKDNLAYISTGGVHGKIEIVDLASKKLLSSRVAGHTPMSPFVQGDTLYFCNRFDNNVVMLDLKSDKQSSCTAAREPIAVRPSPNGKKIWIANHLPAFAANGDFTAAAITCHDRDKDTTTHYPLSNGAQGIRGMEISPDGRYLAITHILSRYQVPTTQLDRGWINTNAVTIVDTEHPETHDSILLDDVDFGAANPWAVKFTPDGKKLIVSHAGIHEISVIDFPELMKKIKESKEASKNVNQLSFLDGLRVRIPLPLNGPRSLATDGEQVFVPGYFSDNLVRVSLGEHPEAVAIDLAGKNKKEADKRRRGKMYFNDASLCFQAWESCASCHPDERVDGLNWDLMNDGIGNPKNTRSMLFSHHMAPVMTLGIRKSAEVAVKAGFRHIQFVEPEEDHTDSVDEYLRNMQMVASPFLRRDQPEKVEMKKEICRLCHAPEIERGALTDSAKRGKEIFKKAGCVECHPHPFFTTREHKDVGTLTGIDKEDGKQLTVPTLLEIWRTAPYFHDGRTTSLKEVVTIYNKNDKRGKTSNLSDAEINDLVEYLKSL